VRKLRARPAGDPLRPETTTPPSPGGAAPTTLLSVTGLAMQFGDQPVLNGVSLDVGAGQVVALVGENGAGKTTLVKCIAGVIEPDAGVIRFAPGPFRSGRQMAVVWQDLALCENLDVVANLFLGRERALVAEEHMESEARRVLARLGIDLGNLRRPVDTLSGGERQLVAIARAMLADPTLLILDEPTAALAVAAGRRVTSLVRELRARGTAVLIISHRPDEIFEVADRIVVLRQGRVAANLSSLEAHPDDVVALMSGIEVDSTARRQLHQLHSLAGQLSGVEPSASLPLIVSSAAAALGVDQLCLHLLDREDAGAGGEGPRLQRGAAVGLPEAFLAINGELPLGRAGGLVGVAAETGDLVVVEDVGHHPDWEPIGEAAVAAGVQSAWAAPIIGGKGVLGVLSGYAGVVGRPPADQLELVSLYAGHAAAAIERGRLLAEITRRNRILEALRTVLERLAGPDRLRGGLNVALLALCRGLGADAAVLVVEADGLRAVRAEIDISPGGSAGPALQQVAESLLDRAGGVDAVWARDRGVLAVGLGAPDGSAVLAARWQPPAAPTEEARDLLEDGARSLRLALEREALDAANQEAAALRRSHGIQREFLSRLSHELRTPLTAIHGYASSLRQPDVEWDASSEERFLAAIVSESARMSRLVADLLDSSALTSGVLRLQCDWCDLRILLASVMTCIRGADNVEWSCDPDLGPLWGDHDRLEQVFVNLVENAVRHTPPGTPVRVSATLGDRPGTATVRVMDQGPGLAPEEAERLFEPYIRGHQGGPGAGLGLSIARGVVEAHGGSVVLEPIAAGACFLVTLPMDPPDGDVGIWEPGEVANRA
jgi:signal transduction histidine kinase/ABC-type multidrug transport system ATPase subunit